MLIKIPLYPQGEAYIDCSHITAIESDHMVGGTKSQDRYITRITFTNGKHLFTTTDFEEFIDQLSRETDIR